MYNTVLYGWKYFEYAHPVGALIQNHRKQLILRLNSEITVMSLVTRPVTD